MVLYLDLAKSLATKFSTFTIKQIPRDKNTQADALANLGSTLRKSKFSSIPLIHLLAPSVDTTNRPPKPSVPEPVKPDPDNPETPIPTPNQPVKIEPEEPNFVASVTNPTSWTQPISDYLEHDTLSENKAEVRALRFKASRYTIIQGVLFKNSIRGILQRCIREDGYEQILKDFQDGECGAHSAGRTLANRILAYGYYWPTLREDAHRYVRKCDSCQRHSGITHKPSMPLHPTLTPWPFMRWGMDIVGKLPAAPGQKVYMLALTDYFSKWIEADAFQQVRDKEVINFIWTNIICRFGVPSEIVCDNGSQSISAPTKNFFDKWNITLVTSTPRYPQANGQAESSNKVIIGSLKKKLKDKKERNTEELSNDLDTIEERRDLARIRMATYQQMVARSFNRNVKARMFKVGNWVLRKVFQNTQELNAGTREDNQRQSEKQQYDTRSKSNFTILCPSSFHNSY
ncbi:uncharacterized protein LOC110699980 [Chenopodium quinoa]|uniref:uncharacterized protein LOC110699980 n=1 Tax=Chenopodium quinoa TaxID=63459 RepID=UPI000B779D8C|nr:uncharacterized protein LOC110699980 [Chenopodium quinoa]